MKRTTLFADDEVLQSLRRIAQEQVVSVAKLVRQALYQFIIQQQHAPKKLSFLGIGKSGKHNVAENAEEFLWKK